MTMSFISGLLLMTLVCYEMQNVVSAILFVVHWPAEMRIQATSPGFQAAAGDRVTQQSRLTMWLHRWLSSSVLMHEGYSRAMRQVPIFKTTPSLMFGLLVAVGCYFVGLSKDSLICLSTVSSVALFFSSQTHSILSFYSARTANDAQLEMLIQQNV